MPVEITLRESQGYISGLPPEVIEPLQLATSFRPEGYQFTMAFQRGRTDGRVKLFKSNKFPAGLVGVVTDVLQKHGAEYNLTVEQSGAVKSDLPPYELVGIQSRDYQDNAVEAALLNPRGIIRAPTGSGKTAIGARIAVARGKHTLIVVPTIDLLHQYKAFLEAHLLQPEPGHPQALFAAAIGQLGDGVVDPQPITVATVRTAAKAVSVAYAKYEFGEYDDKDDTDVSPSQLREWVQSVGTLIVDEAHILGAQTTYDISNKVPALNKYGMSASPWRDDGADLMIVAATGPVIFRIGTGELVRDGHLVPPVIRTVDTKGWWNPARWGQTCARCGRQREMTARGPQTACDCGGTNWRSEFTDAYKVEIVENPLRNMQIAKLAQTLPGPTLILVKQKKHGKLLEQMIPGSRFLSGNDTGMERVKAFDDMRAGKLVYLIATTIADMGLDIPILRTLVLAGGGKSSTRHLQRIGRVARPYTDKTSALVVDFDDSHVHRWFRDHLKARRKIERAEWGETAIWI